MGAYIWTASGVKFRGVNWLNGMGPVSLRPGNLLDPVCRQAHTFDEFLAQAQIRGVRSEAGQPRIDELPAEELIRGQAAEQLNFLCGEFHANQCHGILGSTAGSSAC